MTTITFETAFRLTMGTPDLRRSTCRLLGSRGSVVARGNDQAFYEFADDCAVQSSSPEKSQQEARYPGFHTSTANAIAPLTAASSALNPH